MHETVADEERYRKDRSFDPAKRPASEGLLSVIEEAMSLLDHQEARIRRRRPRDEAIVRAALSALIADAAHRAIEAPGSWITIELSKAELSPRKRRAPFMTEAIAPLVHYMAEAGLLEVQMGYRTAFRARRTRIRASEWLLQAIDERGIGYDDIGRNFEFQGDTLILRDASTEIGAPPLALPAIPEVDRYREEMAQINAWLEEADLAWTGDEAVDTRRRFLRRVFNNGSLRQGGRLYHGFWQDLGARARLQHLLIAGCPVASLDFAQMAVRSAYALAGVEPPQGDLYAHPWYPREGVKMVLNALLSSSKPLRRMPSGGRQYFKREPWPDVERRINAAHPNLGSLFYRGVGMELMFLESEITVRALLALKEAGVHALPVHDCLLVGVPHVAVAQEVLLRCSREVLGWEVPVTVDTLSLFKQSMGLPVRGGHKP